VQRGVSALVVAFDLLGSPLLSERAVSFAPQQVFEKLGVPIIRD
jgi:hypothetical protein